MEEKSIFMRGSSLIMRMPSRWTLSKPTKVRTLSIASGVTLSVFFFSKPKPQRLMSGAQVTS